MLCKVCENINFDEAQGFMSFVYRHHVNSAALKTSAEEGCNSCQVIFNTPGTHFTEDAGPGITLLYDKHTFELPMALGIAYGSCGGTASITNALEIAELPDSIMEVTRSFTPENNPHTGSRENLKLASAWLQRCLETHTDCNISYTAKPVLPTRVIDVGPPDGSFQPVLHTTKYERDSYVALSHCWGRAHFITTTSETLTLRETGIPLEDMPKTFQHAVYVTRAMQVRYLWIDSLCILQDSIPDWEVESSKMAEYFGNALFTIAADDASDANEGCFRSRNPLDIRPAEIKLKFKDISVDKGVRHYIRHTGPYIHRSLLQTRGWTLQEELLSRRLFTFGKDRLSFHCLLDITSESHPEELPMDEINQHEHRPKYTTLRKLLHSLDTLPEVADEGLMSAIRPFIGPPVKRDEQKRLYGYWYSLIEDYCSRRLTKVTDTLPAIAGIAVRFKEITNDSYLAGLWKSDLGSGLLWRAEWPGERPSEYIGPSWSWLSIQSQIRFPPVMASRRPSWPPFIIQDAQSSVVGANPFGKVDSGILRVRGVLNLVCVFPSEAPHQKTVFDLSARVLERFREESAQWPKWAMEEWTMVMKERKYMDKDLPSPRWSAPKWYYTGGIGTYHADAKSPWFHLVWCLPVTHNGKNWCGLALVPTEDGHQNRFKRVGQIDIGYSRVDYKPRTICIV